MTDDKPAPREVEIVNDRYQPSKAELEADMGVDATFDEALAALMRPVRIQRTIRPSRRRPNRHG